MLQPGYSKIRTKDGGKFYAPSINLLGKVLHLKGAKRTATEALNYSRRFCQKWELLHAKKEISGN
jgi:hypothetical protein